MAHLLLLGAALVAPAQAFDETGDSWIRGVFTGLSPRPSHLAETEAWNRAGQIVHLTPDTFVLVGDGRSMQPLYPPGTLLVLRQVAYHELQRGQTAVYRNRDRRPVAHVLIAKCRDGWRAKGLNNPRHDAEPVVAENLIGVVIAAFTPTGGGRDVASR